MLIKFKQLYVICNYSDDADEDVDSRVTIDALFKSKAEAKAYLKNLPPPNFYKWQVMSLEEFYEIYTINTLVTVKQPTAEI